MQKSSQRKNLNCVENALKGDLNKDEYIKEYSNEGSYGEKSVNHGGIIFTLTLQMVYDELDAAPLASRDSVFKGVKMG